MKKYCILLAISLLIASIRTVAMCEENKVDIIIPRDGSLKVRNNNIVGIQENWLVGIRYTGIYSHYYHLADVTIPEGYIIEKNKRENSLEQSFSLSNEIIDLYISPVASSIETIVESVYPSFSNLVGKDGYISKMIDYQSDYGICKSFYYSLYYKNENSDDVCYSSYVLYIPCFYDDCCILISASLEENGKMIKPNYEMLFSEVIRAYDNITIIAY